MHVWNVSASARRPVWVRGKIIGDNSREIVEFWKVMQAFSSYLVLTLRNMGCHWRVLKIRGKYDIS